MISTLTSKGQVTLPKKFRDYLGVEPGAVVEFALNPQGEVIVHPAKRGPARRGKHRFDALRGSLSTGKSTDELMALLRGYDGDAKDPGLQ